MNSSSEEIISNVKEVFSKNEKFLKENGVRAAYVYNSLARGDFLDGASDADILMILEEDPSDIDGSVRWQRISEQLNTQFAKRQTSHAGFIDMPWEIHGRYEQSRLKCFKYFFDDLLKNHIHIYGEDVLPSINIPPASQEELLEKLKSLIAKYHESGSTLQQTLCIGESIRYFLRLNNIQTLNKFEIIKAVDPQHSEIVEFYERYIQKKLHDEDQGKLNNIIIQKFKNWIGDMDTNS